MKRVRKLGEPFVPARIGHSALGLMQQLERAARECAGGLEAVRHAAEARFRAGAPMDLTAAERRVLEITLRRLHRIGSAARQMPVG